MATNIEFILSDFTETPLAAKVFLSPNSYPLAYGNFTVTGNQSVQYNDGGIVTYSNVVPGIYNVRVTTSHNTNTEFSILVPESSGSLINANTIIITQASQIPSGSFNVISSSYSKNAATASLLLGSVSNAISSSYSSTASFALNGGGSSNGTASYLTPNLNGPYFNSDNTGNASINASGITMDLNNDGTFNLVDAFSNEIGTDVGFINLQTPNGGHVVINNNLVTIGNVCSIPNLTGSLFGSASFATSASIATLALSANTATSATTATFATSATSASYAPGSPSVSASYAGTASVLLGSVVSSSYSLNGTNAISASKAISSSFAASSSYAGTASILLGSVVSSSFTTTASYTLSTDKGLQYTMQRLTFAPSRSLFSTGNITVDIGGNGTGLNFNPNFGLDIGINDTASLSLGDAGHATWNTNQKWTTDGTFDLGQSHLAPRDVWCTRFLQTPFIGAVGQIDNSGEIPSRSYSQLLVSVNGSTVGTGMAGDSGLNIANYSTNSINSGCSIILNISDPTGHVVTNNSCAWCHVPSNRIPGLMPGWNILVYNSNPTYMRGLAVQSPGGYYGSSMDLGNYSYVEYDLINGLTRFPHWYSGSYQPLDTGWRDAVTFNPVNGDSIFYGTASFLQNILMPSGSLLIGTASLASFANTSSMLQSSIGGPSITSLSSSGLLLTNPQDGANISLGNSSGITLSVGSSEILLTTGGRVVLVDSSGNNLTLDNAGNTVFTGVISGSVAKIQSVTGSFTGSFTGIATSSSYCTNATFLNGAQFRILSDTLLISSDGSGNLTANSFTGSYNGITNPYSTLPFALTSSWTARANVIEDRRIITTTGSFTLNVTGLYNGWNGSLKTIQSGSGGGNIIFPSGSAKVINGGNGQVSLTAGSGSTDLIGLAYDGTNILVTYGNAFS